MDTKKRILDAALELFNEKGTGTITVRHIATRVGISHGNLCYHFPTLNNIITRLYFNLADELDAEFLKAQKKGQAVQIGSVGRTLFDLLYKYRFLMLDFVDVMRRIPEIKKHYRKLQERRKLEFLQIFENLVKADMMKKELYPGFFNELITNMTIVGDAWIAHAEILYSGKEKDKLDFYYRVASSLITPLLTEKGLAAFSSSGK